MDSISAEDDQVHVEQLEVFARVGVTESERAAPQRLTLTISVWPDQSFDKLDDDITRAVNYSALCVAAQDFIRERSTRLIETLAENLSSHLLKNFPIRKARIEMRKFVLPDARYASVVITRTASLN